MESRTPPYSWSYCCSHVLHNNSVWNSSRWHNRTTSTCLCVRAQRQVACDRPDRQHTRQCFSLVRVWDLLGTRLPQYLALRISMRTMITLWWSLMFTWCTRVQHTSCSIRTICGQNGKPTWFAALWQEQGEPCVVVLAADASFWSTKTAMLFFTRRCHRWVSAYAGHVQDASLLGSIDL